MRVNPQRKYTQHSLNHDDAAQYKGSKQHLSPMHCPSQILHNTHDTHLVQWGEASTVRTRRSLSSQHLAAPGCAYTCGPSETRHTQLHFFHYQIDRVCSSHPPSLPRVVWHVLHTLSHHHRVLSEWVSDLCCVMCYQAASGAASHIHSERQWWKEKCGECSSGGVGNGGAGVRAVGGRALVPRLLHPARITRQLSLPPFSKSLRSE
jgi:hypothetical protein